MPEEGFDVPEKIPVRPREQIESDLKKIDLGFEQLDKEELEPIRATMDGLPDSQKTTLDEFVGQLGEKSLTDEEIRQLVSPDLLPLCLQMRAVFGKVQQIENRRLGLEKELTPYRKQDLERLVRELEGRVNYEAVFGYYRSRRIGEGGSSDLLVNTRDELFYLRKCQYELINVDNDDEVDFCFYDSRCVALEQFKSRWEEKGFLLSEDQSVATASTEYGEPVTLERKELVDTLRGVLDELHRFNKLIGIYRHALTFSSHFDYQLDDLYHSLDVENGYRGYGYENFEAVDYDPRFIQAARLHAERVIEEHRRLGNLPVTPEVLKKERERIDSIEETERINGIKYEGFDGPEGMIAVVTPQEIMAEVGKLLPPDFLSGLKALSRKEMPTKLPEDDQTTETMGRFVPVFGDKGQCDAAEIEIYRDLFVPPTAGDIEKALVRADFIGTVWHEFGHNAHHLMRYEEMESWEQVIVTDKTAVTWYVKHARADNEDRGKREDFSDSFRLFLTNPALLYALSPQRYQFMNGFFERRLKTSQVQGFRENIAKELLISFAVWEKNGYSQDDIKRVYLSHEF